MSTNPPDIALSTASVYPLGTAEGFRSAARVGYDGIEIMVGLDEVSADKVAVKALSETHEIPVLSVHSPGLLVTQRVWGTEPWAKLHRAAEMALHVGADTVVVHPPFRWQREYARGFVEGVAALEDEYPDVKFAVENMYPWRTGKREFKGYAPGWDPREYDYRNVTVDFSHASVARIDTLKMLKDLGERVSHIHLADGTGQPLDEHLVPGRGDQRCGLLLEHLMENGYTGNIAVEISTRKAADANARDRDLREALNFARRHTEVPATSA